MLKQNDKVFIRTVTFHYVGRVELDPDRDEKFVKLVDAAWIADSGRWMNALAEGETILSDVEPFPDPVYIAMDSIVDVTAWRHGLPLAQK